MVVDLCVQAFDNATKTPLSLAMIIPPTQVNSPSVFNFEKLAFVKSIVKSIIPDVLPVTPEDMPVVPPPFVTPPVFPIIGAVLESYFEQYVSPYPNNKMTSKPHCLIQAALRTVLYLIVMFP